LALAIGAMEALMGRALDTDAVVEAADAATAPGRMEVAAREPVVMLDGAHNPPGMAALAAALAEEFPSLHWRVVFGAMADKDVALMLDEIAPHAVAFHTAAADSERAMAAAEVADLARGVMDGDVTAHASVAEAVEAAVASGDPVLVTGSIYVVGEARVALRLTGPG
jgi:dihydrofolate synthase/folylpolyglutamate synthase